MSAARIDAAGAVTTLDGRAEPDETVTENDVKDTAKLAKVLARVLATIALLKRSWTPSRVDFEDCVVTNPFTILTLEHGFGGRVRWWVVDQTSAMSANQTANTTADTLELYIYGDTDGTCTVRVEEAG